VHEISLVDTLFRRVEDEARARGALAVHRVRVSVGELSGVDPGLFRTAFETFREGTACGRAVLDLVTPRAAWSCEGCGRAFAAGERLRCEPCGLPARASAASEALLLESIELEVP
jgi:hydrogenase nickel incorporation protein HypA/HybF